MRWLDGKLGETDPHEDADRWFIWLHAVEEFLWPTSSHDRSRKEITLHPMFWSWCSEWGSRLGLIDGVWDYMYPDCPPLDLYYGKEAVRQSEGGRSGGLAIATELDMLWENAWKSLLRPSGSGMTPTPQKRQSSRGLKLSLLSLVLRLGVFTGDPPQGARHRLVHWGDAVDAAALHLALSVLHQESDDDFVPPCMSWGEVKERASEKLSSFGGVENPKELRGHADSEGIEGYRKRLRATMSEAAFRRVASLAAEFERQCVSGLEKWRNDSCLLRWFAGGRA